MEQRSLERDPSAGARALGELDKVIVYFIHISTRVRIEVEVREATAELVLNAAELGITGCSVDQTPASFSLDDDSPELVWIARKPT